MQHTSRTLATTLTAFIFVVACGAPALDATDQSVQDLFDSQPQFGQVSSIEAMPDWGDGPRRRVRTSGANVASYEVYLRDGEVTTVWTERNYAERELVWGTPGAESRLDDSVVEVEADTAEELPAYTILSRVDLLVGGRYGEVLIPTMTRDDDDRERVFRAIVAREGFTRAAFYSTEDAFTANGSAAFLEANPEALREGFLGSLTSGDYVAGEVAFP